MKLQRDKDAAASQSYTAESSLPQQAWERGHATLFRFQGEV